MHPFEAVVPVVPAFVDEVDAASSTAVTEAYSATSSAATLRRAAAAQRLVEVAAVEAELRALGRSAPVAAMLVLRDQ